MAKIAVDRLRTVSELLLDMRLSPEKSKVSQIFDAIRALIVEIKLLPGQQISELEVADALETSKTPVREALIRLEDAGLVRIVPKSGTYVTPIRIDRYVEACFIRVNLEIGAVRRAARKSHTSDADFCRELDEGIAEQEEVIARDDYRRFFELDEAFHRALYQLAGVPGVWWTVKGVQADVDRVRHLKTLRNIRKGPQIIEQHRAIRDAIAAGSPADAETALLAHIGGLGTEIETLSRQPGLLEHIEILNAAVKRPHLLRA
ncbi:GntR family transcriptional regulator [Tropicimonas sediminicola]|uniref:Transcriptional regulator, GntR family n=1 Tax=Tropicimonas sediminicola TaxID=1031541 RepID=A0A239D6H5_9RHOB|nr:GntR family transcriptional regulator [Tropicimonas sediminicola]SNS27464.1 transcriptional regulator, GntR family [Tropicimonas sediminicola]